MTKKERLEAIINHYSDGKPTLFAKYLGVAPSTISSWLSRDTLDYDLIFAKCESISSEWLLTGEGEMLKSEIIVDTTITKDLPSIRDPIVEQDEKSMLREVLAFNMKLTQTITELTKSNISLLEKNKMLTDKIERLEKYREKDLRDPNEVQPRL